MTKRNTDGLSARTEAILVAAMPVFGRFGYRKTSMDDLAKAARISKPGLYLHFASKEDIFSSAVRFYLNQGLEGLEDALANEENPLGERLFAALNLWFGRHLKMFNRDGFDVISKGNELWFEEVEDYRATVRRTLERALAQSSEFSALGLPIDASDLADVLFTFGLTWKEEGQTSQNFASSIRKLLCACGLLNPAE